MNQRPRPAASKEHFAARALRSKSLHHFPMLDLDKHRRLLEKHLPKEILL